VEPHAPRAWADGMPEAGRHVLPAQANGILAAELRARPAPQVDGIPEAQPRVPLARGHGIPGVQPHSPRASPDGIPGADLRARPAARAADTVQPELKVWWPALMEAKQWPQPQASAEVGTVEPLPPGAELAPPDSVKESAPVGVAPGSV
jgi:hypothetical protein